jgi:hypothetical protein
MIMIACKVNNKKNGAIVTKKLQGHSKSANQVCFVKETETTTEAASALQTMCQIFPNFEPKFPKATLWYWEGRREGWIKALKAS